MSIVLALLLAAAPPPKVGYRAEATGGSWQPIEPADLAKAIEQASLEVLSKPGLMQLSRWKKKDEQLPDYLLTISGRLLDEAETHTVHLTFGPGGKSDLPSFHAGQTVVLSKLPRKAMLDKIEGSARAAAADLLKALEPELLKLKKGAAPSDPPPREEPRPLPFSWSEVRVPKVSFGKASTDLFAKDGKARAAALRELTSLALVDAAPRNVLERCVLTHPEGKIRAGCLVALRPLARRHPPTQRVVIEALRKDDDNDVLREANEQLLYLGGIARQEAIAAWLELAAQCRVMGPMDQLGDVPNLDLAIRSCLVACGKKPKYQRSKRGCIEMLPPIRSYARKKALLWRGLEETDASSPDYIEGAGASERSTGTDWQWAVEALIDEMDRWDPALEEILWRRYQRTLSASSLDLMCEHAAPSAKLVDRLLEVVQTAGDHRVLHALERAGKSSPELAAVIREKVAELIATEAYPKTLNKRQLEELLRDITPREKKP